MQIVIDISAETYKAISEWEKPNPKYAAEYMLYQFVKNGKRIEQTNCTDAISRTEAIRVASGYCHWSNIPKELEKLPSVSTEKTGHWSRKTKVDAYDLYGVKTWGIKCQCDRCTFTTTVVEDFGYYGYCPNCGARMEVEE